MTWCVSLYENVEFVELPNWWVSHKGKNKKSIYWSYFILQADRKWEIVEWVLEWDYLVFGTIKRPVYNSYCLFNSNEWFKIMYAMESYTDVFRNWGNIWDVPKEEYEPIWELIYMYRTFNWLTP